MPNMTRRLLALCIFLLYSSHISAYIYDNRYFRILEVPYSRERFYFDPNCCQEPGFVGESRYRNDLFVLTANDACGSNNNDVGIPQIFGPIDLGQINTALSRVNPNHDSRVANQPVILAKGKLEGQGISFAYDQQLLDWLAAGLSFSFLHLTSHQKFIFNNDAVGRSDDDIRRKFNDELGFRSTAWRHTGITDVDAYVRFGYVWNYALKCRRIDSGLKIGALFPTGIRKDLFNPASVPFGGDGRYGFYVGYDGQFEVKEDLKLGLISRLIKRFAKTSRERLPVAGENQLFGALVADARIEPGVSFVFAPYGRLEGIRDGLGVMLNYTLVWHDNDVWEDRRSILAIPQASIAELNQRSRWAAEIVTLNFFYDFSKVGGCNRYLPLVSLSWDIPVCYLIAENVVKTNNIALGIEFRF